MKEALMRLIFVLLFLLVFSVISLPLLLVELIIGLFSPKVRVASSQRIVALAFRILLFICGVKRTVIGVENIPKNEPILYVSNHRSYFDIPVAYTTVPTLTSFIAKKEIARVPILRTWMRFLQCLFLDRNDIRQGFQTILKAIEQVKAGYSIFIAPEGTRNHGKDMLPFHEGSFKIAEKTGCAIIPVSINNADAVFENHMPWIRSARVVIEYGKPIYIKDLPKEQQKRIGSYVQGIIRDTLEKNSRLISE